MPIKQVKIDEKLYNSISEYCNINNLKICNFINELLKKQFMLEKYGIKPSILEKKENNEVAKKNETMTITNEEKVVNKIEHKKSVTPQIEENEPITQIKNTRKRKLN